MRPADVLLLVAALLPCGLSMPPVALPDTLLAGSVNLHPSDRMMRVEMANVIACLKNDCLPLNLSGPIENLLDSVSYVPLKSLDPVAQFIASGLRGTNITYVGRYHMGGTPTDGWPTNTRMVMADGLVSDVDVKFYSETKQFILELGVKRMDFPELFYSRLEGEELHKAEQELDVWDDADAEDFFEQENAVAAILPEWPAGAGASTATTVCTMTYTVSYRGNCLDVFKDQGVGVGAMTALTPGLYPSCQVKPGDELCLDADVQLDPGPIPPYAPVFAGNKR